jgi:DNA-binding transcriptional LysR family regulator
LSYANQNRHSFELFKETTMPEQRSKLLTSKSFELRHLRYFCALVEEKNFERAAAKLGIAQPGLSQQIMALETILGAPLLDRSRRAVQLTQSGEVLYREAVKILMQVDATMIAVNRAGRGEIGQISIGYVASAAYSGVVFETIRKFKQEYPDGLLDMGFVRWPALLLPGLTSLVVRKEPLVAVLSETHPLAHQATIELQSLKDEIFITPRQPADIGFHGTTIEACHSAGFEPNISAQALDFTEIASRASIGMGVALAPKSLSAVGLPGIRYIDVAGISTTSDVALAFRKSEASQAVKSFIAMCRRMGL